LAEGDLVGQDLRSGDQRLRDGSRVIVIGAGPAGSFFAMTLLREARRQGRTIEVSILERRRGLAAAPGAGRNVVSPSCNYCAGGISPRMNDILDLLHIPLPPGIVQNRIRSITVQSHWKNVEIKVPTNRRMLSVYRGSRPMTREDGFLNFDALLLREAEKDGAEIVNAEATSIARSGCGRPKVTFRRSGVEALQTLMADLVVFAGGVNQSLGGGTRNSRLMGDLRRLMPGFTPPRIRQTLIFELELSEDQGSSMAGELYFILFGSRRLRLEMGSLMPKGKFVTVVLIGPDIDRGPGSRKRGWCGAPRPASADRTWWWGAHPIPSETGSPWSATW
jgi:hypothetical protein